MSDSPLRDRYVILCVSGDPEVLDRLRSDLLDLAEGRFGVVGFRSSAKALSEVERLGALAMRVPLLIAGRNEDTSGVDLITAFGTAPDRAATRKVLLGPASREEIGRAIRHRALDATLSSPWSSEQLRSTVDRLITEYLIEEDPGALEQIPDLVDVELLAHAFSWADEQRRRAGRQLEELQTSFRATRMLSDDEVEQAMIAELDRALFNPDRETIPAGTVLLRSGDEVDRIWVVLSGRVRMTRVVDDEEVVLYSRTAGRIIGLLALARVQPAAFNVTAANDLTVIPVTLEQLDEALRVNPALAVHFVGVLLRSLARRAVRSTELQVEIGRLAAQLEDERDQLALALTQLKQAETRLIESEKMATLGQLVAGIGHELNNPVAAITRAAEFLREDLEVIAGAGPAGGRHAEALRVALESAPASTREERRAREALAGALGDERLARRLVGIGILTAETYEDALGDVAPRDRARQLEQLERYHQLGVSLRNIRSAAGRIGELVRSLRSYARADRETRPDVDVRAGLEDTLLLFGHALRNVEVVRDYGRVPQITANPGELNQVWTNLISNAIDAMGGQGTLTVSVEHPARERIRVQIADTGPGIAPEDIASVFDLRFTTKEGRVDFGLGLGLTISHEIVTRHGGTIGVTSEPGNTRFTVELPVGAEATTAAEEGEP